MMQSKFEEVAKSYYPTEKDRVRLQQQMMINETSNLFNIMQNIANRLLLKDIRFAVFHLNPNDNPPRIDLGLSACCDNKHAEKFITDDLRKSIEEEVKNHTKYQKIVWAL